MINISNIFNSIISFFSLLTSFYAVKRTVYFNRKQEENNVITMELSKLLLKKEQVEAYAENAANVSACFTKTGNKQTILKIFNNGKALAKNVNIKFPDHIDLNICMREQKLPTNLEEHQHLDLDVSYSMNCQRKIRVILNWEDDKGSQEKEMELSL